MSQRALLESVADAVAAGEAVDWRDVEQAAADTGDADLISQLKIVSAIGATRRAPESRGSALAAMWNRVVETGVAVVLMIAVARLMLVVLSAPAEFVEVVWLHAANVVIFGTAGVVLLAGGGRDRRLPLLGGMFLTIGSAFATILMPWPGAGVGSTAVAVLGPLLPEAFLPLMMWRFVREFPVESQRVGARRIARILLDVSFVVGAVLLTINAVGRFDDSMMPAWFMALFELLDRDHPERIFWPLLFAIGAPEVAPISWTG